MLGVPFFCCALHELFATIFSILRPVEVRNGFLHFSVAYLITYTIWANEDSSVSSSVTRYYSNSWLGNNAAALSHSVTQRPWHCETRLTNFLAPDSHRAYFFACSCWLELIKHSSHLNNSFSFLLSVRFMISWDLLNLEHFFLLVPKNVDRGISTVRNYKVVFLNKHNSRCATTKLYQVIFWLELLLHYSICFIETMLYRFLYLAGSLFAFLRNLLLKRLRVALILLRFHVYYLHL